MGCGKRSRVATVQTSRLRRRGVLFPLAPTQGIFQMCGPYKTGPPVSRVFYLCQILRIARALRFLERMRRHANAASTERSWVFPYTTLLTPFYLAANAAASRRSYKCKTGGRCHSAIRTLLGAQSASSFPLSVSGTKPTAEGFVTGVSHFSPVPSGDLPVCLAPGLWVLVHKHNRAEQTRLRRAYLRPQSHMPR